MNHQPANIEFGRVLRASTSGFAVGCRVTQLENPAFGCLVKAHPMEMREAIYGLIYDMHIDDDPVVRRLVLAETPRISAIEDQRQNRLLPIEMSVLAVGYQSNGAILHGLPPRPPLNLDPVELCLDREEVIQFTEKLGYLRLILRNDGSNIPVDQLLIAHILNVYELRGGDTGWAMHAIEELIDLLRSNYEVLVPVLEGLSNALPEHQLPMTDY